MERAFKYWAQDGLVRQVGDNPVRFTLANLKQLTLTQAENRGISCITKSLSGRPSAHPQTDASAEGPTSSTTGCRCSSCRKRSMLMLLKSRWKTAGGASPSRLRTGARREWAQSGIRTVDDVEKVVVMGREARTAAPQAAALWVRRRRAGRKRRCTRRGSTNGASRPRPCRKPAARRRRERRPWRISTAS